MKLPAHLIKAMLITAAIGTATSSCTAIKTKLQGDKVNVEQGGDGHRNTPDPCTACGMG